MLTRNGIAYNLTKSPYRLTKEYEGNKITFVFSSELYMNKFSEKLEENRKKVMESLSKRWGLELENNALADLKLYSTVEKRGFLIEGEESYQCLSNIKLSGVSQIIKN